MVIEQLARSAACLEYCKLYTVNDVKESSFRKTLDGASLTMPTSAPPVRGSGQEMEGLVRLALTNLALCGPTFLGSNVELALNAESSISPENMPKSLTPCSKQEKVKTVKRLRGFHRPDTALIISHPGDKPRGKLKSFVGCNSRYFA